MEEILSKIIKRGKNKGEIEAFFSSLCETNLIYRNNTIKDIYEGSSQCLGVKVTNHNKFGFALTSNLNAWEKCLNRAVKLMKVSEPLKEEIPIAEKTKIPKIKNIFSIKLNKISISKMINFADKAVNSALALDKKILVSTASLSKTISTVSFLNTNNVKSVYKTTLFSSMVNCIKNETSGSETKMSHYIFDNSLVGKAAAQLCLDSCNPKKIFTGKYDLILDYFALSELIEAILIPSLQGDNVLNSKSFLKDKLGKKVFSEKFSVSDNGLLDSGIFSSPTDAQGTQRQNTLLIEEGIVKSFLYDLYSAKLAKTKSTGNCASIDKVPSVGPSNFLINKGDYSKEEMIKETKIGLFVPFVVGAHVVNNITGDVSVAIGNAQLIKSGEIKYPIKQVLVSFNFFEALKNISAIGRNIRQDGIVACPLIKFDNVQVIS